MMLELADKRRALPLFEKLTYNLVVATVVDGIAAGTVYADDVLSPRTALLWDQSHGLYLAGEAANGKVIASLSRLLADEILPEAARAGRSGCVLFYSPDSWEPRAPEKAIPRGRRLVVGRRILHKLRRPKAEVSRDLPAGCALEFVVAPLLGRADLTSAGELTEWWRECWASADAFRRRGFGFWIRHGEAIVSWCITEYVAGARCGVGAETDIGCLNRGLATLAASALVEHCYSRGLVPHWDSWASNLPSVTVAKKLGFDGRAEYPVYWVPLD